MTFNIDIDSSWTILQVQDKPKILAFKWESKNSQKKKSVSWFLFSLLLYYWVVIPTPFSSNWFSCSTSGILLTNNVNLTIPQYSYLFKTLLTLCWPSLFMCLDKKEEKGREGNWWLQILSLFRKDMVWKTQAHLPSPYPRFTFPLFCEHHCPHSNTASQPHKPFLNRHYGCSSCSLVL